MPHRLAVAAVEREGDTHLLAVVARDLQPVGAPAGVALVNGDPAVVTAFGASPAMPLEQQRYLSFATAPDAQWPGNFRDLAASVTRMATLSPKGRIDMECVHAEIARLQRLWSAQTDDGAGVLAELLNATALAEIDPFDRVQLAETIRICRKSRSLSEAGRVLFAAPRARRSTANDADRLKKYLNRFGLDWTSIALR